MKMSLAHYKKALQTALLDIAWAQWNRLGVYGGGRMNLASTDIEAAMVHAAYAAWMDGRLLEGVLSWLRVYHASVSPERLKLLLKDRWQEEFLLRNLGAMIASTAGQEDPLRWRLLLAALRKKLPAKSSDIPAWFRKRQGPRWTREDPIFSQWGLEKEASPLAAKLQSPRTILQSNPLMRLRYLFGATARPDILYLLGIASNAGDGITAARLAGLLGYHHSSIFRILQSFENGGAIEAHGERRAKNTSWVLTRAHPILRSDDIEERRIIDWRRAIPVLKSLLLFAATPTAVENEDVFKHSLALLCTDALRTLSECGIGALPPPPSPPLADVSVENMMCTLIESCEIFVRQITALPKSKEQKR
jgi:hypothetical protein